MTTQYYTASSIDGFIADSDNSLDWLFQFSEKTGMEDQYPEFIAHVGAMAMGSTTYEWVAEHTGFLSDPNKWEYTLRRGCSAAGICLGWKDLIFASSRVMWGRFIKRWSRRRGQERLAGRRW
jgi:hypothetical protein